ncbi:MAG: hypothetical protein J0L55_09800 [Caulobacterales bacterium]|nr:hypothetical protein [Caulobacterales bacterium]MCA0372407.1 hypothetical protein [Pseudomonadota bacterium]
MGKFSYKKLLLSLGLISCSFIVSQNIPAIAQAGQKVIAPKTYYWLDASNGGKGFFGAMANIPFMKSGDNNAWGNAYDGMAGKHADIAVLNKDFPNQINATQNIPNNMGLSKSISLLPITNQKQTSKSEYGQDTQIPPDYKLKDFKMSFYWGCGAKAKAPPKVFQIKNGVMTDTALGMKSRNDPNQNQSYAEGASKWPNLKDKRNIGGGANMLGNHSVTGANLPATLAFAINDSQNFMGDLGLSSSGDKSGIISLKWNALNNAKAYYFNAIGFKDGEMVMWSASDVPDMGSGLMNYLSPSKLSQFLSEKAILPPSQTKCDIPSGIFANMQMVMVNGIGYGDETTIIYPARPSDPRVTWVQEWSARFRNKSVDHLMVGMPSMGDAMRGETNAPSMTPEEKAKLECEKEKSKNASVGKTIGGAFGGGLGSALGGALGKSKTKCPN